MADNERRVVITGMGVVCSIGRTVQDFWRALLAGQSGVERIGAFDPTGYDCQIAAEVKGFDATPFFRMPKDARRSDRNICFAVAAARQALGDSGLDLAKENLDRAGCTIGSGVGGLSTFEQQFTNLIEKGPSRLSPFTIPMMIVNMASGITSMELGLRGPNFATVSACATSAHAIGEAFRAIKHDDADIMFAGGTEATVLRTAIGGFAAMKALSTRNDAPKKASRPFDRERDGFVMGEGSGIVVLEELERARKRGARIYCEVTGYGQTADAHHMTAPSPGGEGAARCMRRALETARLRPDQISYINAHGTSTQLNDKFETAAIKTVFGDLAKKVAISSTKSMTGHLLGAAGAVEMIVCALAITHGVIPPTINYEFPDPDCDLDYTPNQARELKVDAILNNALGFGGHNCSLVAKRLV
ncbi:MAG: beta-ketoacyl-ACP synthase II [Verrucomicrobia bacterium]|nr:beta-ketoacyl-ACP synthase II [Verrucomicrobiota bacterium]